MSLYSVIADTLWREYGYTLPDAPGYMAEKIIKSISLQNKKAPR